MNLHLCSDCFAEIHPQSVLCRACQVDQDGAAALADDVLALALDDVASITGVAPEALLGTGRSLSVARARKALYVRLRNHGLSFPEIGRLVGRDSSTVYYGVSSAGAQVAP